MGLGGRRQGRRCGEPVLGRPWIWGASVCASWPGQDGDRYIGPFDVRTANDVLIIGNRNDPATRYQDAVSTSRIMPVSRLLTLEGSGHTSLFLSRCVDRHLNRYLLTGAVPDAGTVCQVDVVPFSAAAASDLRGRGGGSVPRAAGGSSSALIGTHDAGGGGRQVPPRTAGTAS